MGDPAQVLVALLNTAAQVAALVAERSRQNNTPELKANEAARLREIIRAHMTAIVAADDLEAIRKELGE